MNTVISSRTLDDFSRLIMEEDSNNRILIPQRLKTVTSYERQLEQQYDEQDITFIVETIDSAKLSLIQLSALDNLCRWNFRNSGSALRSTIGLTGVAAMRLLGKTVPDESIRATDSTQLTDKFILESAWATRRIFQLSCLTGTIEAKLPMLNMSTVFAALAELSDPTHELAERELARMRTYLATLASDTVITQNGDDMQYCAKLLIQVVKAAREYKLDDSFGKLRSFLNNASHTANMIRVVSKDADTIRLACDVADQIHSADRLLNANSIAADELHSRMIKGELIYDKLLDFARHQHRIIAVEALSAMSLVSYLISVSRNCIVDNSELKGHVSRLIRYSGAGQRYMLEIGTTE